MSDDDSIYEQIGGEEAIEAVVDSFYERVLDDEQLVEYFEDTDMDDLRAHQVTFISHVTGGPVTYDGADMRTAHAHLDLTDADFAAVADHLRASLAEFDVPEHHVDAIMSEVAGLEADVLNR